MSLEVRYQSPLEALLYFVWNAIGVKVPGRKEAGYARRDSFSGADFYPIFIYVAVLKYST